MKLQVKKAIALSMTMLYLVCALYGFITKRINFSDINAVPLMIITYYFGHRNLPEEK